MYKRKEGKEVGQGRDRGDKDKREMRGGQRKQVRQAWRQKTQGRDTVGKKDCDGDEERDETKQGSDSETDTHGGSVSVRQGQGQTQQRNRG